MRSHYVRHFKSYSFKNCPYKQCHIQFFFYHYLLPNKYPELAEPQPMASLLFFQLTFHMKVKRSSTQKLHPFYNIYSFRGNTLATLRRKQTVFPTFNLLSHYFLAGVNSFFDVAAGSGGSQKPFQRRFIYNGRLLIPFPPL